MYNSMIFPATVDEFMEEYKVVDSEHVYSNGMEMVPIFRMKQWLEHEANHNAEPGKMVDDTVSRQAAMEMLMAQNVIMDGSEYHNGFNAGVNRAQEVIRNLPPVQPQRTKGEWITSDDLWETGICSCCGWDSQEPVSYAVTMFKFCPNCGADMRGEVDG